MKKLSYICLAFLGALGLASCGDSYTDWAAPQSNAQDGLVTIDGFSATGVDTIKLADVTTETLKLYDVTLGEMPEGYTYADSYIELTPADADNALTTDVQKVNTNVDLVSHEGVASTDDFAAAVKALYGAAPYARTLNGRVVLVAATTGGAQILINCGTIQLIAVPDAPEIATAYYYVGTTNNWDATDATYKMDNGGGDVYQNPVFTVTIPSCGGDNWFKIRYEGSTDLNSLDAKVVGPSEGNGQNGMSGATLAGLNKNPDGSDNIGAFKVNDADCKYLRITIDMLNQTYSIEKLNFPEYIYQVGDNPGWGNGYAMPQGNGEEGVYYGAFYMPEMANGYKFKSTWGDSWPSDDDIANGSGFNLGADANGTEGVLVNSGNSGNIKVTTPGFYWLRVDAKNLTYEAHPFTTLGLIGDATQGSWTTDTELTYDADGKYWYANNVVFNGGDTGFKVRSDASWNNGTDDHSHVDLGGSTSALVPGAGNIPTPGAGTYNVKVYLENNTNEATAPHIVLEAAN